MTMTISETFDPARPAAYDPAVSARALVENWAESAFSLVDVPVYKKPGLAGLGKDISLHIEAGRSSTLITLRNREGKFDVFFQQIMPKRLMTAEQLVDLGFPAPKGEEGCYVDLDADQAIEVLTRAYDLNHNNTSSLLPAPDTGSAAAAPKPA